MTTCNIVLGVCMACLVINLVLAGIILLAWLLTAIEVWIIEYNLRFQRWNADKERATAWDRHRDLEQ